MTLPCACWLLKQKRHGHKIKKIEKTRVSFKPFFLNFYTLNGYKFYRKKLLDKTKKLGRVFYIINLSAFIDSCKCVDKRNDCQLNSGIKRCKTKIFLPIYISSPKMQKAVTNKKFKIDFLIEYDVLNRNTSTQQILHAYIQK